MHGLGLSGGFLVIYNFIEHLVRRGHEVYVVTPETCFKWEEGMQDKIVNKKMESSNFLIKLRSNILNLPGLKEVKKIRNKARDSDRYFYHVYLPKLTNDLIMNFNKDVKTSDILVSTLCFTAFAGYLLSDKVKKAFYHMQHYEEVFFLNSNFKRNFVRSTYFLPHNLISNSTWLKSIIEKICNRSSELINPAIDLGIYKPYISLDEKYKGKKYKYTILSFVDASREFKGSKDLYDALQIVWKKLGRDNITIKSFGFSMPSYFKNMDMEFLGYIHPTELPKFYSSSDVFVLPSLYESFPLQPIEAMACGTTLVTTKFGTEDYAFNNVNSLVVYPRRPEDLAEKIILALKDREKSLVLAKNALETVKKFSWERQTDKLEKIFSELPPSTISAQLISVVENLTKVILLEETTSILF